MTDKMQVNVDWDRSLGLRDERFFGYFLEHFHRQIYGGIYDPGSPLADENGFRRDVAEAVQRLRPAVLRWPGGCFASAYHWAHGVGPNRLPSYDKAWRVEEPNTFGTDEFIEFCRLVGTEPYICTNAGTGTPEEMSDWLEYCNLPGNSRWARLRAQNGHSEPHDVKLWSIGNENYGFWEVGAHDSSEWGRYVLEAAKMMRRVDDRIVLSAAAAIDFEWDLDLVVDWGINLLRAAAEQLDLLAVHGYAVLREGAPYAEALASWGFAESRVRRAEHLLELLGLQERVGITFDEWNPRGWHFPGFSGRAHPDLSEWHRNDDNSTYTMADAILHAGFLNTCLRHCATVKMTNLSPLVNTRGPVFAHPGGVVLRPTYHVCDLYTSLMFPEVLDAYTRAPTFGTAGADGVEVSVPRGDAVVTIDREGGDLAAALSNLHPDDALECQVWVPGRRMLGAGRLSTLTGASPRSFNDVSHPDDVTTSTAELPVHGDTCRLVLGPHSVNILRLQTEVS
jgi:alpha-L-arabinofuranosidase